MVILHGIAQIDGFHHAVARGVHTDAVDLVHVKGNDIERVFNLRIAADMGQNVLANRIVLVFQRAVHLAVAVIEVNAAQMAQKARDAADHIALQVHLQQRCGEGHVNILLLRIHAYTLAVAGVGLAGRALQRDNAVNVAWELARFNHCFLLLIFHPWGISYSAGCILRPPACCRAEARAADCQSGGGWQTDSPPCRSHRQSAACG